MQNVFQKIGNDFNFNSLISGFNYLIVFVYDKGRKVVEHILMCLAISIHMFRREYFENLKMSMHMFKGSFNVYLKSKSILLIECFVIIKKEEIVESRLIPY